MTSMSKTGAIKIWVCTDHHAAFLCGGWAYVRMIDGQLSGAAGGERATSPQRMAMAGLTAALSNLPPATATSPVTLYTSSPELAGLAVLPPGTAPGLDRDLWDALAKTVAGRPLNPIQLAANPMTPLAFTAAWAELARDKAKARGSFKAVIPKPNLAKIAGLPAA